jgi:hypothetical protein
MVDAIHPTCYSYRNAFVNHLAYSDNFMVFYQNLHQVKIETTSTQSGFVAAKSCMPVGPARLVLDQVSDVFCM